MHVLTEVMLIYNYKFSTLRQYKDLRIKFGDGVYKERTAFVKSLEPRVLASETYRLTCNTPTAFQISGK